MPMRGRVLRRWAVLWAVVAWAVGFAACGGSDDAGDVGGLRLTITPLEGSAELPVAVTVTNDSADPITVVRPFVTPHFVEFRVEAADGSAIPFDGPRPRLEPLIATDVVTLDPGDSVSSRYELRDHFTLPPGTYTVSAQYQAERVHHGGLAMTVAYDAAIVATPIVVEVTP
jgi:hypothetical protein